MEGECLCHRSVFLHTAEFLHTGEREHFMPAKISLMEGEWSCYRSGHFNEWRMVMLQKSPV